MGNEIQRLDEKLLQRMSGYIVDYQKVRGSSPGQREIAAKLMINSKRTFKYVHILADRGLIELDDDGTIVMPRNLDSSNTEFVPVIGAVKCGKPSLAVEDYDGMFRLPRAFTGTGEFFMLTAEGDSMKGANIFEGDYLVIRRQETADGGDIVVACKASDVNADEEATLKRYIVRNGKPLLHPENEKYEDMDARDFRIIGKLKCVIRKIGDADN